MLTIEIRNPSDAEESFDQIEIQRGTHSDGSDLSLYDTIDIDSTNATDLSTGYTTYFDESGDVDLPHYYRFRFKNSLTSELSTYSPIFQAGTTEMHTLFRRRMRDMNPSNYFFANDEITDILSNSVRKLYPATYNEVIDESLTTDNTQRKYSFPVGVNRLDDIEFIDSQGDTQIRPVNYQKRARQIIFDNPPPSGYTMRLFGDKMFLKFAEVPDSLTDLVLDLMILEAYLTFEADRSSYYRYTTVVVPEGGNLPSIGRVIERLIASTNKRLNELRRVRKPGVLKLT